MITPFRSIDGNRFLQAIERGRSEGLDMLAQVRAGAAAADSGHFAGGSPFGAALAKPNPGVPATGLRSAERLLPAERLTGASLVAAQNATATSCRPPAILC
jgi:hypothetical protein